MDKINGILVVDDDNISQFITVKVVERMKIADCIFTANNGLSALQKLVNLYPKENYSPELILLDLEMPVMDGIEFLEAYSELNFINKSKVRIFVLSAARLNENHLIRLRKYGIETYLQKPVAESELKDLLRQQQL